MPRILLVVLAVYERFVFFFERIRVYERVFIDIVEKIIISLVGRPQEETLRNNIPTCWIIGTRILYAMGYLHPLSDDLSIGSLRVQSTP